MKLTIPQRKLLKELHNQESIHCVDYFPPAKALLKLGLAEWLHTGQGNASPRLHVTPAGIAEHEAQNGGA